MTTTLLWLGSLVVVALVGLVVGAAWSRAGYALNWLRWRVRPSAHRLLDVILKETREANIWERPPILFPESQEYLRRHWAEFWKDQAKGFEIASIIQLAGNPSAYAGQQVLVPGHFATENRFGPPRGHLQTRIIQAISTQPEGNVCLLYARAVLPVDLRFDRTKLLWLKGVVLAGGPVRMVNGQLRNGAYLLSNAVFETPPLQADS